MNTIETERRGIKRIIKIQFFVISIIITVGGIIYGINTGKWSSAFMTAISLLAFTSLFAPLTYMAATNRHEKFFHQYRANCESKQKESSSCSYENAPLVEY